MRRFPTVVLALLVPTVLAACGPKAEPDLTARLLFTASGSYDAQADTRDRVGGGLRRVAWTTQPPLPARAVTVRYDSDARPLAWEMLLDAPEFSAADVAGAGASVLQTPQGEALRPAGGRLADVLILKTPGGLRLLTRGYAAQQDVALLPALGK